METEQLADLIVRAQKREPEAFDALVDAYSTRLYGYFYRLTGSRCDAEDLLQELFVRLVRMIDRYKHEGRFDAWLFRIATNLVRDRVRRARRQPDATGQWSHSDEIGEVVQVLPDVDGSQPGDALDLAEQLDQLQEALGKLPTKEREVILLRHFSGMSFKEISELLGVPLGTALARSHRGLSHLRGLMGGESS